MLQSPDFRRRQYVGQKKKSESGLLVVIDVEFGSRIGSSSCSESQCNVIFSQNGIPVGVCSQATILSEHFIDNILQRISFGKGDDDSQRLPSVGFYPYNDP